MKNELRAIRRVATELLERLHQSNPCIGTIAEEQSVTAPFPALTLPNPPDIHLVLSEIGASPCLLQDLSRIYTTKSNHARETTLEHMNRLWQRGPFTPARHQAISNLFCNMYLKEMAKWKEYLVRRVRNTQVSEKTKRPFNAESVPLLEKYFQYNAYPSACDRSLLATKTSMDIHQINVWFQNHRRRARKHGGVLPRLTPDQLPQDFSLADLENIFPKKSQSSRRYTSAQLEEGEPSVKSVDSEQILHQKSNPRSRETSYFETAAPSRNVTPQPNGILKTSRDNEAPPSNYLTPAPLSLIAATPCVIDTTAIVVPTTPPFSRTLESDILNPGAPKYAFPLPFSIASKYHGIFPELPERFQSPPLEWMRTTANPKPRKQDFPPTPTVEQLAEELAATLNLRRDTRKRGSESLDAPDSDTVAWNAYYQVHLCRGRHPAFIEDSQNGLPQDDASISHRPLKRRRTSQTQQPLSIFKPRARCSSTSSTSSSLSTASLATCASSLGPYTPKDSPLITPLSIYTVEDVSPKKKPCRKKTCLIGFQKYAGTLFTFTGLIS